MFDGYWTRSAIAVTGRIVQQFDPANDARDKSMDYQTAPLSYELSSKNLHCEDKQILNITAIIDAPEIGHPDSGVLSIGFQADALKRSRCVFVV